MLVTITVTVFLGFLRISSGAEMFEWRGTRRRRRRWWWRFAFGSSGPEIETVRGYASNSYSSLNIHLLIRIPIPKLTIGALLIATQSFRLIALGDCQPLILSCRLSHSHVSLFHCCTLNSVRRIHMTIYTIQWKFTILVKKKYKKNKRFFSHPYWQFFVRILIFPKS